MHQISLIYGIGCWKQHIAKVCLRVVPESSILCVNYCSCVLSLLMEVHCRHFIHISDYCFGFLKNATREVKELQWKMDICNIPQGLDYCRILWRGGKVRLKHWKFYLFDFVVRIDFSYWQWRGCSTRIFSFQRL